jgi:hypothetical protein
VKDKLLYLTVGLLIGIVVMQWTMPTGRAADAIAGSGAIAIESAMVLDEYGQVLEIVVDHTGTGWFPASERTNYPPLPVPVSQVKLWSAGVLVTEDNSAWRVDSISHQWVNCGPWPGGAVPTSPTAWGGVKGKYDAK